ncbi:MAG: hypothetical protein NTW32_07495 [Chloroflexi bacterium]|nr:hypothetical protein [Chloroflexota bacterium]
MRIINKLISCVIVLACLTACGPLTPVPVPTRTPSPAGTLDASRANMPTRIPATQLPASWQRYTDPTMNINLRYPQNWQTQTSTPVSLRMSGPDGFFEISSLFHQSSIFEQIDTLCILDANNPDNKVIYGNHPTIYNAFDWNTNVDIKINNGCIVSPSSPDGSQTVFYGHAPYPEEHNRVIILRADSAHFAGIFSSLRFINTSPQNSSGKYHDSSTCKETPRVAAISTYQLGEFVITEQSIAKASCDPWLDFEGFQSKLWALNIKEPSSAQHDEIDLLVKDSNRDLAPFGYRLVVSPFNNPSIDLYKGEALLIEHISYFSAVSVNTAGDDFILWVRSQDHNHEVRWNSMRTLENSKVSFNSVWLGANLTRFEEFPNRIDISSNESVVQSLNVPRIGPSGIPLRRFWSWKEHWFVQVSNVLMQDGAVQNLKLGFDEIFAWQVINDKPFFIMRQGQAYGMVYADQIFPFQYQDIIHGDLCCDPATYRVRRISNGIQFYAQKEGVWYLVTIQKTQ